MRRRRPSWDIGVKPVARRRRGDYLGGGARWRELSRRVIERDGHKCRECGRARNELAAGERLECHHRRSLGRGGSDRAINLVTLCSTCHSWQPGHSHLRRKRR